MVLIQLYLCCVVCFALIRLHPAGNRGYAISDDLFTSGVCAVHVRLLEGFLTAPIQLERAGIALQGANSFQNIKGAVRRFLGYCASVRGEDEIAAVGLLSVLDGTLVAGFVGWLLQSRETTLSTAVQTMLGLEKVCAYTVATFFTEEPSGAPYVGAEPLPLCHALPIRSLCALTPSVFHAERVKCLTRQLQTWHNKVRTAPFTMSQVRVLPLTDILSLPAQI